MFIGDASARIFVVSGSFRFRSCNETRLSLLTKHAYALARMPVYHYSTNMDTL